MSGRRNKNVPWKENDILEALNYDLDVPCPLQRGLLWFSSPSRLNRKFANDGTKVAKNRETVNMAIEIMFQWPLTECTRHVRAVSVLLCNLPDKDWNREEESKGWGLVGYPVLPPCSVGGDEPSDA